MYNEAEKIVIYLSPYLYNTNIALYIIIQDNFNILNFNCLEQSDNIITIFYNNSHYDKIYTNEFLSYMSNLSIPTELIQDRIINIGEELCKICEIISIKLDLAFLDNYTICKNCLLRIINDNIFNRYKNKVK